MAETTTIAPDADLARKNLTKVGKAYRKARTRERQLAVELYDAIRAADEAGIPRTHIADLGETDRMTVYRALGLRN